MLFLLKLFITAFLCISCSNFTAATAWSSTARPKVQQHQQQQDIYADKTAGSLLLVSTIDGYMNAIDAQSGQIKWRFREGPLMESPVSIQRGFTFIPDPRDGQLYLVVEGRLSKLPFTIPHLVRVSPCKSSDGVFYAGSKKDVWISIDPDTGDRSNTFATPQQAADLPQAASAQRASNTICPANRPNAVHIGKTEYHIQMMDTKRRDRHWNATFVDYSSHLLPEDAQYPLQHFTSSADGRLLTVDAESGTVLWQKDFGSVIVNMYLLKGDGMHKLPSTAIGQETFDTLAQNAVVSRSGGASVLLQIPAKLPDRLFPTLYVGEHSRTGLYALPAFVDERTNTFAPKHVGPPLLEGPKGSAEADSAHQQMPSPNGAKKRPVLPMDTIMLGPTYTTEEGEFLLLGYHNMPEAIHPEHLFPVANPNSAYDAHRILMLGHQPSYNQQHQQQQKKTITFLKDPETPSPPTAKNLLGHLAGSSNQQIAVLVVGSMLVLLFIFVLSMVVLLRYLFPHYADPRGTQRFRSDSHASVATTAATRSEAGGGVGGDVSRSSRGSVHSMHTADGVLADLPLGWHRVNDKLRYDSRSVLGRGCDGTVVYRGQFDGRDVAVKRVQSLAFEDNHDHLHRLIEREVAHLRESDSHANVIRYFCSESDHYFRYIALELCEQTLEDFIKEHQQRMEPELKLDMLKQATEGIAHLHSIKIVHRDVKPKNILINGVARGPPGAQRPRVKISDFGLCKTVKLGHNSISKVSGVVGTEGWMAPELFDPKSSVTYAVDVFSLGCVFYYVFTEGAHPFGDSWLRMNNIIKGCYSLDRLTADSDHTSRSLIEQMLRPEALQRPTAPMVVAHPMFWEPGKQLQFLLEVSDRIEKLDSRDLIMRRLEWRKAHVVGAWLDRIDEPLRIDLMKQRSYQNNVRDLLRAIRNKKHHYQELSLELRTLLGHIPDQYIAYFTSRFPQLLMHAFCALTCCARESVFRRDYYTLDALCEFCERERCAQQRADGLLRRSVSPSNWRHNGGELREIRRIRTPTPNMTATATPAPPLALQTTTAVVAARTPALPAAFNPAVPPPALNAADPQAANIENADAADGFQPAPPGGVKSKKAARKAKKTSNSGKRKARGKRKAPFAVLRTATTAEAGAAADTSDDEEEEAEGDNDEDGTKAEEDKRQGDAEAEG